VITIHQRYRQTDRQTDRQTTCDGNTALCTKVHRAVKIMRVFFSRDPGQILYCVFRQYEDHLAGMDACRAEFERWQHWCNRLDAEQTSNSVSGALTLCDATLFPNMRTALKIFATLPVTTCTAERSFSVLRLVKTHLRSTMGNSRLSDLALLSVHKTVKLNYNSVIAEYARKFNTRARLTE